MLWIMYYPVRKIYIPHIFRYKHDAANKKKSCYDTFGHCAKRKI